MRREVRAAAAAAAAAVLGSAALLTRRLLAGCAASPSPRSFLRPFSPPGPTSTLLGGMGEPPPSRHPPPQPAPPCSPAASTLLRRPPPLRAVAARKYNAGVLQRNLLSLGLTSSAPSRPPTGAAILGASRGDSCGAPQQPRIRLGPAGQDRWLSLSSLLLHAPPKFSAGAFPLLSLRYDAVLTPQLSRWRGQQQQVVEHRALG